jgi:lambda family phage portal protein
MPAAKRTVWDRALRAMGLARLPMSPRASSMRGAGMGRLFGDFSNQSLSADQVIRMDGPTLRSRAIELVGSNSTASRVPQLFSENVIGKDGILLKPLVGTTRQNLNKRANDEILRAWWDWYEPSNASVDKQSSWCELETLIVEGEPVDGEVLIRLVDGFDNPHGFAVDVLDVSQLDWTLNQDAGNGRNEIRLGIERDKWGTALTYHILANHPSEMRGRKKHIPVPAEDIIHLYFRRRPKQSRGYTWFAPVLIDLNNLGGYREAELIAARSAAAKMGFLQKTGEDAGPALEPEDGEESIRWDADPGVIEQLPEGWAFQSWDPTHPTTAFADFESAILRSIATALRVSYMSLSGDLNGTSYGSGRIGLKAEQLVYQKLQQRLIEKVHTRVYRRWLKSALLKGALRLDSFDATRYHEAEWHPRAMPWIDPKAEIESAELEQKMGISTLTQLAASQGKDLQDNVNQTKAEIEMYHAAGLVHPNDIAQAEVQKLLNPPAPAGQNPNSARALRVVGEA